MTRILVVIPAYNEADNIADMVRKCKAVGNVLVVDDGSTDETAMLAEKAGAVVMRNCLGSQYGDGIKTGFGFVLVAEYDIAITINAGRTHTMPNVSRALSAVSCEEPRIVFGWRVHANIVSLACGFIMELMTHGAVKDYSSFRVMNRAAVALMLPHLKYLNPEVYSFCPEFSYVAWKLGIAIDHILITRTPRNSSLTPWKFVKAAGGLVRIWWRYR